MIQCEHPTHQNQDTEDAEDDIVATKAEEAMKILQTLSIQVVTLQGMKYYTSEEAPLSIWNYLMIKMTMQLIRQADSSTKETPLGPPLL
jgi:hypothetical protein